MWAYKLVLKGTDKMKKILSLLLVVLLVITCSPLGAFKADATALDYHLTYKVSNGFVTITGCDTSFSGEMIIPDTIEGYKVKVIDESAFANCASITSVVIPDSVLLMKKSAFSNCTSLENVVLSNNLTELPYEAFMYCEKLSSITFPEKLTTIGDYSFERCTSFTDIVIPEGIEEIGSHAFWGCKNIKSVTVPSTLQKIGEDTFEGCYKIEKVYISDLISWCELSGSKYTDPDAIPDTDSSSDSSSGTSSSGPSISFSISFSETSNPLYNGADLYLNGKKVTELVIPDGIGSLGQYAFCGCSSITSVVLPESTKTIGYNAFLNCVNIKRVVMPGIEYISTYAFRNCENIEEVYITDLDKWCSFGEWNTGDETNHPTCYGADLYLNGKKVTDVVVPENLTKIYNYKFYGCASYKTVTIHKNITYIDRHAFENCDNLEKIIYYGTEEQWNAIIKAEGNDLLYLIDIVFAVCDNHVYDVGYDTVCNVCGEKGRDFYSGDANGDNAINGKDAAMLIQYINNWGVEVTPDAADVNCDGKINIKDYILIVRYLNGWKI